MTGQNKPMGWLSDNKHRLTDLITNFGWIAAVVWFSIFALTWSGFALALSNGLEAEAAAAMMDGVYELLGKVGINISPSGAAETTGVWALAYGLTQLTKPLRIIATIVLTPLVARVLGKTSLPASEE